MDLSPAAALDAFDEVLVKLGGRSELARLCKVTRQSVQQWKRIPSRHVRIVARETGFSLRKLRPDLYDASFYGSPGEPVAPDPRPGPVVT